MGLQEVAPLSKIRPNEESSRIAGDTSRTSGGYGGMGRAGRDIMVSKRKELVPDFAKRVQAGRRKSGIDQRALASRVGERLNVVQRIENGKRPTDSVIDRIERELGIELWVDREVEGSRALPKRQDRSMTLGDLLDERLKRD